MDEDDDCTNEMPDSQDYDQPEEDIRGCGDQEDLNRRTAKQVANTESKRQQLLRNQHLKQETVRIIESLLDEKTDPHYLRKCVSLLSKSDYNDLNTERSLSRICGYPLCDKRLTGDLSQKQKFKIDMKRRKVFRMQERAMFCSVYCLESSDFLKSQLSDEALWLRFNDRDGYEALYQQGSGIQLKLQQQQQQQQEIASADQQQQLDKLLHNEKPFSTCVKSQADKKNFSTRESVSFPYIKHEQMVQLQNSIDGLTITERKESSSRPTATNETPAVDHRPKAESDTNNKWSGNSEDPVTCLHTSAVTVAASDSGVHHPSSAEDHHYLHQKELHETCSRNIPDERVIRVMREWLTNEALLYILGDSFYNRCIKIKDYQLKERLGQDGSSRKRSLEQDIERIVERLDRQDLLEDLVWEKDIDFAHETKTAEAAAEVNQRQESCDKKSGIICRRKKTGKMKSVSFQDVEVKNAGSTSHEHQNESPLPVTSNDPSLVRRQIVFDQLHESLMSHITGQMALNIVSLLKPLISRLNLTAANIFLDPSEWTMVALFLLRFLRVRDQRLVVTNSEADSRTDSMTILNDEKVKQIESSFYKRTKDWEEKVDLFLFQTVE